MILNYYHESDNINTAIIGLHGWTGTEHSMVPVAKSMKISNAKWYIPRAPYNASSGKGYTWFSGSPENGWKTETLLNYECFNTQQARQRILSVLSQKVDDLKEDNEETSAIMSHAMYSVLRYMGGRLTPQECSSLSPDELEVLRKYEEGLLKLNKKK